MRPFRATQDSARLMSLIFISVQIRTDQLRPTPLRWGRSFFIIYCGIRMSGCRHRGFSGLCSFSDVKGNITRHYVPFSAFPASVHPSSRPTASSLRRFDLPPAAHCAANVRSVPRPCGGIFQPSTCPRASLPMPDRNRRPFRFSQHTRLRAHVHALNKPKHPL